MSESWPVPRLHTLCNGQKVPDYVLQDKLDQLKTFELYPDDVWICAYPKSGTHWTSQIARLIKNEGVEDGEKISSAVPWPEMVNPEYEIKILKDVQRPRLYRSHFSYDFLPCGPPHATPCKYIYVTRNPKDVAISFYCFMKNGWQQDLKWDDYWEKFMNGDVIYGDYFDHLLSWLPHKDDKNVLFLKYEDMKRDLALAVSKIASFMEVNLSSETIDKIAKLAEFDTMKKDQTSNISWVKNFQDKDGNSTFMRKGTVGDWKNYLSVEQSAEMDRKCAERLKGTDFVINE